jgi:hypothetical protein
MSRLEPASALALRLPWRTHEELTALIEADRAAVREATLREATRVRFDQAFIRHESEEYKAGWREGFNEALALIEKLLTEKRTHG